MRTQTDIQDMLDRVEAKWRELWAQCENGLDEETVADLPKLAQRMGDLYMLCQAFEWVLSDDSIAIEEIETLLLDA